MYHKVDPKAELGLTCISPKSFEKQIDFLVSAGYQLVTLSNLRSQENNGQKKIAICFDDGYQGIYDYAYPILQKHAAVATVFIIGNYIGKQNTWDVNLGGIRYNHLNENSIEELVKSGWEIGSHSMSHRSLRNLSRDEINIELGKSKEILSQLSQSEIQSFAPPFGVVTRRIYSAAVNCGYLNICGFYPFKYTSGLIPGHLVIRLAVYRSDNLPSLKRKLSQDNGLHFEVLKQNVINFCANGTLAVNSLR